MLGISNQDFAITLSVDEKVPARPVSSTSAPQSGATADKSSPATTFEKSPLIQEAIDAPAWHSEHFPISFWPRTARPGVLVVENRVPKATVDTLKSRGHIVETGPDWSEGRLTAASRVGRRRRAAANPRGMQGYAAGR